ncbi:GTPase HflX [Corallococcus exercitus]|uniref:GTPase HflX n=1 Tax=Corallococcus exercitus TaxID=2316736 RepID=A0A3A8INR5_9BACT|nr:GTPase HflX [Corallococcus exercitus]NOK33082.1 GTPase HflX [Corallococcus exercitus]RKG81490.1 GTPase HflX [Corallococcus exercitus]
MPAIHGNTQGLKPSQLQRLEATWGLHVRPQEVVSPQLAGHLCALSQETGRQVGVLIDRRGGIEAVMVGDATRLELPDVGRMRAGDTRLRGLRLVHTHLKDEPLTPDDITDLALLRLDLVCAIETRPDGQPGKVYLGHLDPESAGPRERFWKTRKAPDVHALDVDPVALAEELEEAFGHAIAGQEVITQGRALLVGVALEGRAAAEASMAELRELARTAGIEVLDVAFQARSQLDPRFVVGRGKLEELNLRAMQRFADMIIFDHDLTPAQARHISDHTSLKVLDRTQLILDIFAQHAHSAEGRLQVELAQLRYRLPRLAQRDEGLSRLMGGIGGRGPGETKLEIDRRRVRDRISLLEKRIDAVGAGRQVRRQRRVRHDVPIISIVGYTNAGKSTLLNHLTDSDVVVEDKLFATLDPSSRRLRFPRDREVIITDTVGFIRALPRTLVNAFRATLEELADADLLLHVVDASDPAYRLQMEAVEKILQDLGLQDTPRLLVFNKSDLLEGGVEGVMSTLEAHANEGVPISARTGEGLTELLLRTEELLWHEGKSLTASGRSFQEEPLPY